MLNVNIRGFSLCTLGEDYKDGSPQTIELLHLERFLEFYRYVIVLLSFFAS